MEAEIHEKREDTENSTNPVGDGDEVKPETVIAIKSEDTEIISAEDGNSSSQNEILQSCDVSDQEEGKGKEPKVPDTNDSAIDVKRGSESSSGERLRVEKVCRICHLNSELMSESSELIQLGCSCKDDLGVSHRICAETWFKQKGNRQCEICSKTAKNISDFEDIRLMVDWNEMRLIQSRAANSSRREGQGSCLSKKSFCNFLLICLVLAFILPWFFRVDML